MTNGRFIQSPSKYFWRDLRPVCKSFLLAVFRWMHEINPRDLGNVPSGVSGCSWSLILTTLRWMCGRPSRRHTRQTLCGFMTERVCTHKAGNMWICQIHEVLRTHGPAFQPQSSRFHMCPSLMHTPTTCYKYRLTHPWFEYFHIKSCLQLIHSLDTVKRTASVKSSHRLRSLEGVEIFFLAVSAAGSPARKNMSKVTEAVSSVGSVLRILDEVGKKCCVILSVRPRGASVHTVRATDGGEEPHRSPKIDEWIDR